MTMFRADSPCTWTGCDGFQGSKGARGYCVIHYRRMRYYARDRGTWPAIERWTRRGTPTDDLLEEYGFLVDCGVTFRDIAAKLGMQPPSLARALHRSGHAVPPGVGAWKA